jgi:peptidoglycan/xylan/chitin deacetylase (PgdA/CDA1 family)
LSPGVRLRRRLRGRAVGLILCYHRVAQDRPDPWELCVSPQHFAEHLEVISAVGRPVPLPELTADAKEHDRPLVAVTFDDGYADNLHAAKPLLEAADVPATVFVVSGAVGQAREFWWDELERALLGASATPPTLQVQVDGETTTWRLDETRFTDEDHERYADWTATHRTDPHPRHRVFREAHRTLGLAEAHEREAAISRLLDDRDAGSRESRRPLTEEELLQLADGSLVEIGAHTVTHPILSSLPESEQRWEVARAKVELEAVLDRPVQTFSYPHGYRHYTPTTVEAVREAGYDLACSTTRELVYARSDPFELPRYCLDDCGGDELARDLDRWLGD